MRENIAPYRKHRRDTYTDKVATAAKKTDGRMQLLKKTESLKNVRKWLLLHNRSKAGPEKVRNGIIGCPFDEALLCRKTRQDIF